MSKFDTNGGYFAPKDYLKVNEGGSHEENPNGGVQIGVDPEGTPNLLEEGEPVYKDYVYSDNIEAEKEFLEQNNLPGKYAGKLYSKIADDLFSEAEERPLDPISRNGLEALLGRLADAQEGQKQAKEQRDLEDELAQLSPEELDQLEAMLAQGEQPINGVDAGAVGLAGPEGPEGIVQAPAESMPVEGMPMMANGGLLRTFADGGPKKTMADEIASEILAQERNKQRYLKGASGVGNTDLPLVAEHPDADLALAIAQPGSLLMKALAPSAYRGMINGLATGEPAYMAFTPLAKFGKANYLMDLADDVYKGSRWGKVRDIQKTLKSRDSIISNLEKELSAAKKAKDHTLIRDIEAKLKTEQFARKGDLSAFEKEFQTASELEPVANAPQQSQKKPETINTEEPKKRKINPWKAFGASAAGATAIGLGFEGFKRGRDFASDLSENGSPVFGPYPLDTLNTGAPVDTSVVTASPDTIKIGGGLDLGFLDEIEGAKAFGGKINRFDGGGWADFLKRLATYEFSKNRSNVDGKYAIDRRYDVWGGRTAKQIQKDKAYKDFTKYVIDHPDDPNVRKYLEALDAGVAEGVPTLIDPKTGKLVDKWNEIFDWRRNDDNLGIYHLNPEDIGFLTAPAAPVATAQNPQNQQVDYSDPRAFFAARYTDQNPGQTSNGNWTREEIARVTGRPLPEDVHVPDVALSDFDYNVLPIESANDVELGELGNIDVTPVTNNNRPGSSSLPTWPRYAGAVGSGLLGLYNAFQSPDRYTATRINPHVPEGRINLQNQVYNPVDQNMVMNAQIAQGNATNRALRNSGLGPSSAAAILASDNNTTGNIGTGFLQTWDANNQRRNAVIVANNQAEAQRANFDYTVDAARKEAFNRFAPYNAQNDLMVQRLNNQAEADKYTAISNQISNGLQALSGIGQENFAMNQINTNPAYLGYRVGPNGVIYYFNPATGRYEPTKADEVKANDPAASSSAAKASLKQMPTFNFNPGPKYSTDPFMGYNRGLDLSFNPLFPNKKKN